MMQSIRFLGLAFIAATLSGCATGERLGGVPTALPRAAAATPRDAHAAAIGADASALRAWEDASRRALRSGLTVAPSFRERIRFPENSAQAVAYRFHLLRGQTLRVRLEDLSGSGGVYADLFEVITDDMFRHVYAADRGTAVVSYRATRDGVHVLRLQPPLAAGGLYEVTVLGENPLLFPVADGGASVGSVFGDPRDGGARGHEGIDIFAPRGTPVVAVAAGTVSAVQTTRAGGHVVWIEDGGRALSYYYAHLEEQLVRRGQYVNAGDTIGTVGNSGNAVGSRPHLHFGIYRPGTIALDPAPLLGGTTAAAEPLHDATMLGLWTYISGDRVRLRSSPSLAGAVIAELSSNTPALVIGGLADWHRVVLHDGTSGFVSTQFTMPGLGGTR
jgi:peptidoglycan LD-endopeptidase LytH